MSVFRFCRPARRAISAAAASATRDHQVREIVCDAIVSTKTFRNATTQRKQIWSSSAAYTSKETIISNISKRCMWKRKLPQFGVQFRSVFRVGSDLDGCFLLTVEDSCALGMGHFFLLR